MRRLLPFSAFIAIAVVATPPAQAADADLAQLRAEITALKTDYDTRVAALEKRIAELESAQTAVAAAPSAPAVGATAPPAPPPPPVEPAYPTAPAPVPGAGKGGLAAFNPAMSVILAGNYANLSKD